MFRPLAFDYTDDAFATQVEDQLLLGNEIMIAPVTHRMQKAAMYICRKK